MTNITLSVEEDDIKQARIIALQQGTSLNAVIRVFLKRYIGQTHRYQQVTERILQQAEHSQFSTGNRKWIREDLYER